MNEEDEHHYDTTHHSGDDDISRGYVGNDEITGDDMHPEDDYRDDEYIFHRWLAASGASENTGSDGELSFMISGWILFALAVANYFISRWSEIRLLRKAGCHSSHDYHTRLCVIEKETMEARRNEEKLRQEGLEGCHLERLRVQVDQAKGEGRGHGGHGKGSGGGSHGAENLQENISKRLNRAKQQVKAVAVAQSLVPMFRGGKGSNKVSAGDGAGCDEMKGGIEGKEELGESQRERDPSTQMAEGAGSPVRSGGESRATAPGVDAERGTVGSPTWEKAKGAGSESTAAEVAKTDEKRDEERGIQNDSGTGGGVGEAEKGGDRENQSQVMSTDGASSGKGNPEKNRESISRRRSDSSNSTGRRGSSSFQREARRMSDQARELSSRIASDVGNMVRKLSNSNAAGGKLNLYNDISDIYLFSSPTFFHKSLDVLLLFSCTYLALWTVNFLPVAQDKDYPYLRHFNMLLPATGAFLFNALSVKTSSLLLAISAMDPEIIGKVIDEQIDKEKLVVAFRERLTSRLDELGLGKSGLASVFEEMDVSGRGELNVKELSTVFIKLNFHVSKEKCKMLFKMMDKDRKGVVTYNELSQMVYKDEAVAQEQMALKMRGKLHAIK